MSKHHGQVIREVVEKKHLEPEHLIQLLNSNKMAVDRLYKSPRLNWDTIATIGRLIEHDFASEFPEFVENAVDAYKAKYTYSGEQPDTYSNIFLVDDSELDTFVFKLTLNKAKKEVQLSTFINGEAAINKLLEISINCPDKLPEHVFLDLKMPVMDGALFLEHFHRLNIDPHHKIKIHVLTSSVFYSELSKYKAHPLVNTYITKPIKSNVIATII